MNILGISAYYHDSAACLICAGEIVAAAQEERFTRKKHDARFPASAINYCLKSANITSADIDYVVYYEKPFRKFDRLLETYLTFAPKGITQALSSLPVMVKEKIWVKDAINQALPDSGPILFTDHHTSHAASAFFPSPFDQAAYLTVDGVGEQCTTCYGTGKDNRLTPLCEIAFPHSLGLLYSAFTAYCGFRVNSDEYKLMGLAPYGTPRYVQLIFDHLIDLKEDGSFRLNMNYFSYCTDMVMTSSRFHDLFDGPPLNPGDTLKQRQMDIASSIQVVTEEVLLRMARHLHRETGLDSLCLAGGVALNCVANGRLLREGPFKNIWIQPAAGDAGSALGAALWGWHHYLDQPRSTQNGSDHMRGATLGPSYSANEIEDALKLGNAHYKKMEEEPLLERTAELLAAGKVVGWHQGRMEYGPRALGNRSILADPRLPNMQSIVNQKIKFREGFRPFAPAILESRVSEYFELNSVSPYMLMVAPVHKKHLIPLTDAQQELVGFDRLGVTRSAIPSVTHVDNSSRIQTVSESDNQLFHRLLTAFERKTGTPLLLNTSFNVSEEPIVCTPADAYNCFKSCDLDYLIIGPYLLDKQLQPAAINDDDSMLSRKAPHTEADIRQYRIFGTLFGTIALIGSIPLFLDAHIMSWSALLCGLSLLFFGLLFPTLLSPFYKGWMKFGTVVGGVVTKCLLIIFYYLALYPCAMVARISGKQFLDTKPDQSQASYWQSSVVSTDEQASGQKQY